MDRSTLTIKPVIGLEIHVQLATRTKMFCACAVEYGVEPNSRVCPVCLGMPGVLPVMNEQAFEYSVRTALALNCQIARYTKWDRKSYYYPDLPKNYQISQYDLPLGFDGAIDVPVVVPGQAQSGEVETRRVRIRRAHLEEDAGKNLHERPGITQVDLNRTGTPLLEIVTEPDLHSADEAYSFCVELQRLVTYLGVSEANMQKGQMRFEPNINVIIEQGGRVYKTPISEVKNLNSFRAVRNAIAYEVERQVADWMANPNYVMGVAPKENRGWDDDRGVSEFQRSKEEAHDYRYFPDPDLVPVVLSDAWIEEQRAKVGELPLDRERRFQKEYGLSATDAGTILADRATADLFESAVPYGHAPTLGKQFISFWMARANARARTIAGLGLDAERLGELSKITADGLINATAAQSIADVLLADHDTGAAPRNPSDIAKAQGLLQIRDEGQMAKWVEEAFAANAKAVQDALANPKKQQQARGFLTGQVMKISGGKADPKIVGRLIDEKLASLAT